MTFLRSRNAKKWIVLLLIVSGITVFFATGMQRYATLEFVKASQSRFQEIYSQQPLKVVALFVAFYIPVIALNLPGAAVLGMAAGALFGTLTGTIVISFASTIGASLACLLSRYLLREWVQNTFGDRLKRINEGIRREGAFYLFSLRLIPVIPFFVINLVMGLTPMRVWTFYWVSQLGMLPGTFVYVNAGSQISRVDSLRGIVSPELLFSLALLGIFPLCAKKALSWFRNRVTVPAVVVDGSTAENISKEAGDVCESIRSRCTDCGVCKSQCAFLEKYGSPKEIVNSGLARTELHAAAYACSLCGLCSAVCPEKLDPAELFLTLRREANQDGDVDLSHYRVILGYEKRGGSPLFSYYGLPKGCDTVFFPGCNLPGSRSETTWQLFRHFRKHLPTLGIVLDCCTKPSHDLGRQDYFERMFDKLRRRLIESGVQSVWVACPNCYQIFRQYGKGLEVQSIYEVLQDFGPLENDFGGGKLALHDPCPLRKDSGTQDAVRNLLARTDIQVVEMKHRRQRTLCCGEGGSVGFVNPDLAQNWSRMRAKEAGGNRLVTYCAGCADFLNRVSPTVHIADLLFFPEKTMHGKAPVSRSPFTYVNRLRLKRRFKRFVKSKMEGEAK